jgi:adenosine deaminase
MVRQASGRHPGPPLTDLHTHVGAAVDPALLYTIAHDQGIRLPCADYWDFVELVTADPDYTKTFEQYLALFHWTELIQSSPEAMQSCVKSIIGGGYRHCNIDLVELRFCPMKRNRAGERDLDHIIMASTHGLDRALLEYPDVRAGIILCADRSLDPTANENIVRKAIKYRNSGVVGIDLAGPNVTTFGGVRELVRPFEEARAVGLGITVHAGEEGSVEEMAEVVECLKPDRIGHGVKAASDERLLRKLAEQGVTLEICPSSNLRTGVVRDVAEFARIFQRLEQFSVKYCINTDGPEMLHTDIMRERSLLLQSGVLDEAQLAVADSNARSATFVGRANGST